MVRQVILWKLKEELSAEEKAKVKREAKEHLEGLVGIVPGLREMHIHIEGLPSSNMDMMLDALLDDAASLKGYAVNPNHVKVADTYVRPYTVVRSCLDYEV